MVTERGRRGPPLGAGRATLCAGAAPAMTQIYVGDNFSSGSLLPGAPETGGSADGDGSIDLAGLPQSPSRPPGQCCSLALPGSGLPARGGAGGA